MNVFVTGGTGFVGKEVVGALRAAGHSILLLTRHPASAAVKAILAHGQVQPCVGDVQQRSSLVNALQGADAVIHLVGIISEVGQATFENVHVRGTENIVAAAEEQGVERFIHMSALGTRPNAVSRYHQTKWTAEECVRASSGLSWTILRPSLIYGPGDAFVNLFARLSRVSPVLPLFGVPEARFQPVSVQNVAKAFGRAVTEPDAVETEYCVCGTERKSLEEILDDILAVLGRRRWKLRVPPGVSKTHARWLEWFFPRVLGKAPPLTRDQLLMLEEGSEGDGTAADRTFGLRHLPFREGIRSYLRSRVQTSMP